MSSSEIDSMSRRSFFVKKAGSAGARDPAQRFGAAPFGATCSAAPRRPSPGLLRVARSPGRTAGARPRGRAASRGATARPRGRGARRRPRRPSRWNVTETISVAEVAIFLPDELRLDRKLAASAVDEDREEDPPGTPEVEDRVDRRPDRPARVEDVVAEDDRLPLDREGDLRPLEDGRRGDGRQVVAVERDVEDADRDPHALEPSRSRPRGAARAGRRASGCRRGRSPRSRPATSTISLRHPRR